jgi:rubrerythrin
MKRSLNRPDVSANPHEHDAPEEESSCLQWRCRGCGAVCLGTLTEKPTRCPACGKTDFEFASED